MPRWSPRSTRRRPITPTSSTSSRSARATRAAQIWTAKISDNVATDENEPEVLFDGVHHAREHLSLEQNLALLRWLTDDYGIERAGHLDGEQPRGLDRVRGQPGRRRVRPHRQPVPEPGARTASRTRGTTAVGTDLNRNYGYRWGCCGGSSGSKSALTYRGAEGVLGARDPGDARLHGQPPDRWRPADQGRDHVPLGRQADPVAVRLHRARTSRPT